MSEENNHEELRPSKMRGVAFPKAKYGAPYFAFGKATPLILLGLNSS